MGFAAGTRAEVVATLRTSGYAGGFSLAPHRPQTHE